MFIKVFHYFLSKLVFPKLNNKKIESDQAAVVENVEVNIMINARVQIDFLLICIKSFHFY